MASSTRDRIKGIVAVVAGVRCIPHLLLLFLHPRGRIARTDVVRWRGRHGRTGTRLGTAFEFLVLMHESPQFRNLFYHRIGIASKPFAFLCPPMESLYIYTKDIGPSLYIQHGFATIIAARRIGANCWINQQVTIGYSNENDCPTLGDNVQVFAGAKVIGAVTIGDNSAVGANAVVVKDVPPNCVVAGVPARIVRRDGVRVDEPL